MGATFCLVTPGRATLSSKDVTYCAKGEIWRRVSLLIPSHSLLNGKGSGASLGRKQEARHAFAGKGRRDWSLMAEIPGSSEIYGLVCRPASLQRTAARVPRVRPANYFSGCLSRRRPASFRQR